MEILFFFIHLFFPNSNIILNREELHSVKKVESDRSGIPCPTCGVKVLVQRPL